MAPFAPFAGRTWKGTGPDSQDIARWEFILAGRALQITHRIVGSDYGGRSIIFYDERARTYVVHYFTTAGFHTLGEMKIGDGVLEVNEDVVGHATITKVRSRSRLEGGRLMTAAEYLRNGIWEPGHRFTYEEAPGAEVGY
jgi:hypothetical protein